LPEALARMRREPTLSVPAREAAARKPRAATAAVPAAPAKPKAKRFAWLPRTFGGYVAILFGVALVGVVVNAVGLQHERHPAPLFRHDPAPPPAPAPAAVAAPAPAPSVQPTAEPQPVAPAAQGSPLDAPPTPVARPANLSPTSSRKTDPINDLLHGGSASDSGKDLIAAQRALIKLGYDLQADGVMGGDTLRALHEFEKSHGLPASSEITPKLIAKLNAAAR
jgi:hypothetical protein